MRPWAAAGVMAGRSPLLVRATAGALPTTLARRPLATASTPATAPQADEDKDKDKQSVMARLWNRMAKAGKTVAQTVTEKTQEAAIKVTGVEKPEDQQRKAKTQQYEILHRLKSSRPITIDYLLSDALSKKKQHDSSWRSMIPGLSKLTGQTQLEDVARLAETLTREERSQPDVVRQIYRDNPERIRAIAAQAQIPTEAVEQMFAAVANFEEMRVWIKEQKRINPARRLPYDFAGLMRLKALDPYSDPKYPRKPLYPGAIAYQSSLKKKLIWEKRW